MHNPNPREINLSNMILHPKENYNLYISLIQYFFFFVIFHTFSLYTHWETSYQSFIQSIYWKIKSAVCTQKFVF